MRETPVWAATGICPRAARSNCPGADTSPRSDTNDVAGVRNAAASGMPSPPEQNTMGHGVVRIVPAIALLAPPKANA